ncbi:MAG: hypothetical protein GEU79_04580 [Acidimicrobiia bacterium]|nr:hypothetical protein [Acidimicrobiia bacterium]
MITGLKPKGFTWVITDHLAVSERIGGNGFQHRRVRRDEEIDWIVHEAGVTEVVSLLAGNQNLSSYVAAGLNVHHVPVVGEVSVETQSELYETLSSLYPATDAVVLVHREMIDDVVAGLLGGYIVYAGLVENRVLALAVIQEIVGRALGPEGRSLVHSEE